MEEAKLGRALLAAGLLTALLPARLADLPPPAAEPPGWRPGSTAAANAVEPNGLELSTPDLLGMALRVDFVPGYSDVAVGQGDEVREFLHASALALLDPSAAHASVVAEPPRALLLLLMLASVAGASRRDCGPP